MFCKDDYPFYMALLLIWLLSVIIGVSGNGYALDYARFFSCIVFVYYALGWLTDSVNKAFSRPQPDEEMIKSKLIYRIGLIALIAIILILLIYGNIYFGFMTIITLLVYTYKHRIGK